MLRDIFSGDTDGEGDESRQPRAKKAEIQKDLGRTSSVSVVSEGHDDAGTSP
jgi:hypothetical protein